MSLDQLDALEVSSEARLRKAIAHLNPNEMHERRFHALLLQRYWISQEFTHIYDVALDRLTDRSAAAQEVIRRIIREEYPVTRKLVWKTPSHRENLVSDLYALGVSRREFVSSRPSKETEETVADAKALVLTYGRMPTGDVPLLAFLRFWGEVLTALEYSTLWSRIESLLGGTPSKFYEFHMNHDEKLALMSDIAHRTDLTTHADKIGHSIAGLIHADSARSVDLMHLAAGATRKATLNKLKFYRQFH